MKAELEAYNEELLEIKDEFITENIAAVSDKPNNVNKRNTGSDSSDPETDANKNSSTSKAGKLFPYLFTLFAVTFLGLFLNNKIKKHNMNKDKNAVDSISNKSNLIDDIELENKIKKIINRLIQSEEYIQFLQKKLKLEDSNKNKNEDEKEIKTIESEKDKNVKQINIPPVQEIKLEEKIIVKYARQADFSDGFKISMLQNEPDSYCIFEIVIKGNSATYKFYDTKITQDNVKSSFEDYFKNTCTYDKIPNHNNNIKNDGDGVLELEGNKLKIIKKAILKII